MLLAAYPTATGKNNEEHQNGFEFNIYIGSDGRFSLPDIFVFRNSNT